MAGFNGKIVSQLVWHFPIAVVAFAAGFTVAVLVEADSHVYWAVFPAILYGPVRLSWTSLGIAFGLSRSSWTDARRLASRSNVRNGPGWLHDDSRQMLG